MKRIITMMALVLILTLSGCAFLPENAYPLPEPPEAVDPVHLQYLTETAARRDISDVKEFTGRFVYSYYKSYVLSTLTVTGFAQKVTVTVASGQEVAEGDVLAQFDTGSLEESIARAQVTVEELRQQVTDKEDALLTARIAEAEAIRDNYVRQRDACTIRAAFAGKIRLNYNNPQNEADKTVTEILLYRDDYLSLAVDAASYQKTLAIGEEGTVTVVTTEGIQNIPASVRRVPLLVAGGYSSDDRDYLIDGVFTDFLSGDKATFTVITETHPNALCVPARAIKQYKSDDKYVRILEADGITRREVVVQTGIENSDYVEIVAGLAEGDRVILG